MPFKMGKRNCPDDLDELLNEKGVFYAGFVEYLEKVDASENLEFMMAYKRKVKNKILYEKFIDPSLRSRLNIADGSRRSMKAFADANDWRNNGWKTHLDGAYSDCFRNLGSQEAPYFRSAAFRSALEATAKSSLTYVDGKIIGALKMVNDRMFINDKNLKMCVRLTKLAAITKRKGTAGQSDLKKLAKRLFKQLKAKYDLAVEYDAWMKLVDKHM